MRIVLVSLMTAVSLLVLSSSQELMAQSPPHSEGQCGGSMRGYDGREYPCGPIRKPACDTTNSRCVCVERVECGGRTNEPY
jgi:hypothetical protein